jgi:hypothetical protein
MVRLLGDRDGPVEVPGPHRAGHRSCRPVGRVDFHAK